MAKKKSETQKRVESIHDSLKQRGASSRDEISVMKCMLNDSKYVVDVYSSNNGEVEKYCPYDDVRSTYKNVLKSAGMTADEAQQVADNYVCTDLDKDNSFKGTGIVHIAPAYGEDDFRVALENYIIDKDDLTNICSIDDNGNYTRGIFKGNNIFITTPHIFFN